MSEVRKRGMALKPQIEWTDATWNPVTGCTKIGPGCDNCYAERFAERWRGVEGHPYEQGFNLRLWPSRLGQPARWKKPRMIFVNSMSDLFHKEIPTAYIDVANCNHNRFGLQSSRFLDRINCDYRRVKTKLYADGTYFSGGRCSSS